MGFVVAFGIMFWIVAVFWIGIIAIEKQKPILFIPAFIIFGAGFGFIIQGEMEARNSGPCVQTEIQMHWNPATKTLMPAEICVNRGKWVDEDK